MEAPKSVKNFSH